MAKNELGQRRLAYDRVARNASNPGRKKRSISIPKRPAAVKSANRNVFKLQRIPNSVIANRESPSLIV
jgi:hypothetical protein